MKKAPGATLSGALYTVAFSSWRNDVASQAYELDIPQVDFTTVLTKVVDDYLGKSRDSARA